MEIPKNAIDLAKTFEGYSAKAYLCPAGFWTIGYGHLCGKDHPPVTMDLAEVYLQADMEKALAGSIRHCPGLLLEKEEVLGAIVDFVFNLGAGRLKASTLRRRINQRRWSEAVKELKKWVYGGGKKLRGLELRREAEAAYLITENVKP